MASNTTELGALVVALQEWTDVDFAQYALGQVLGIFRPADNFQTDTKFVFWSNNTLGSMLDKMLHMLTDEGVLLWRNDPDYQVKWNPEYEWKNKDSRLSLPQVQGTD